MVEKLKQIYVNARIKGLVIAILHNLQPIIVRMITDEYRNSRWLVYGLENIKLITFYSHRNQNEASVIISPPVKRMVRTVQIFAILKKKKA